MAEKAYSRAAGRAALAVTLGCLAEGDDAGESHYRAIHQGQILAQGADAASVLRAAARKHPDVTPVLVSVT